MMPNIEGTEGLKIKTRKHLRRGTRILPLAGALDNPISRNPAQSLQENAIIVFWHRLYNSLLKYLRDMGRVKT